MATVIPMPKKVCPEITQEELSEYCLLRRSEIEGKIERLIARETILEKLRADVPIEDGVLFAFLCRLRRNGKTIERLWVGC